MNDKNFLTFGMTTLFIIVFISFAFIIYNEKDTPFLLSIAKKKLINYAEKTYKKDKSNFKYSSATYNKKNNSYEIKVTDRNDKSKYFIISLKNKKYKDTYLKTYKNNLTK